MEEVSFMPFFRKANALISVFGFVSGQKNTPCPGSSMLNSKLSP